MIRKLIFLGALLLPGLAYGANPTTNLSVQIVPAGTTPAVPAGARAAGFTTLAANYDFTSPAYANPATWLDCAGATNPQWYLNLWWYSTFTDGTAVPCNVKIVYDSVAGSNALDLRWLPSYPYGSGQGGNPEQNEIAMSTMSRDQTKFTDFPNAYYEAVYRITPTVADPTNSPLTAFWMWGRNTIDSPIEFDVVETYGDVFGAYDSGIHNWGNNNNGSQFGWQGTSALPAGYDPTQYHTYSMRLTSDGSAQMSACFYIDNALIACKNPQAAATEFNQRNFLIINNGALSQAITQQTDMYIESVRVWSCASWKTTMCNGTVLTGAP